VQDVRDQGADDLVGIGHRVVHGGERFTEATLLDDAVVAELEALSELAPLHNPPAVTGIRAARTAWPDLPHVASFDTAWFADLPAVAATYALDRGVAHDHGIRRYGMHGLSHQYVAARAAQLLGRDVADTRLVTLHIGNGVSAAAIHGGHPVDTSMGLTPLEGLVMGTRPGDVDAGVLLHLLRQGWSVERLEDLLHHRSGLMGLTGSADERDLERALDAGDPAAMLAYDIYCLRIRKYVGAYLAVLGGADAVVFTAGVGEHSPRVRADSLRGLSALGIEVDPALNEADVDGARQISGPTSPVAVLVVPTNEELVIAREVRRLLDLVGQ
jgi:acetate kinase